ncbi:NAC domain-containing protein 35-like [Sesamum indicum]|uniref:NAC domain-containing protein 35-like n=1 Tax=Sesamum indicum TaxID=4182 RepID=A0A6I9U0Y1_SESIN|nr:NAC domain-containing protein 35-like [Sesamum indicum]
MTIFPPFGAYQQNPPAVTAVALEEIPMEISASEKKIQSYGREHYPPGFHFVPSDAELILEYLKRKILNLSIPLPEICEVNLYRNHPKELAALYPQLGQAGWYFFTPRDRKYRNGTRPNRAVGNGYWKATGADKPVITCDGSVVGSKRVLVFYEGKPPNGEKTNWIMNEYRVIDQPPRHKRDANDMRLDDWVLCRIHKKLASRKKKKDPQRRNKQQVKLARRNKKKVPRRRCNKQQHDQLLVDNSKNLAMLSIHDNVATSEAQFVDNHGKHAAAPTAGDTAVRDDPPDRSLEDLFEAYLSKMDDDHFDANFGLNCGPETGCVYRSPEFGVLDYLFRTRSSQEEHDWWFPDHPQQDAHELWGTGNPVNFQQQVSAPYHVPPSSNGAGSSTDSIIKSEGPRFDDAAIFNNVPNDHYQTVHKKTRRIVQQRSN